MWEYVSAVREEKMIRCSCEAYLAFMISNSQDSEFKVEDILVVREFSDVFLMSYQGFHLIGRLSLQLKYSLVSIQYRFHSIGWL